MILMYCMSNSSLFKNNKIRQTQLPFIMIEPCHKISFSAIFAKYFDFVLKLRLFLLCFLLKASILLCEKEEYYVCLASVSSHSSLESHEFKALPLM